MRSLLLVSLVTTAPLLASEPAAAQPRGTVRVTCESIDQRDQYCPVNVRGYVRLTRQRSRAGCWEGETWGWDRRGIWVTRGCRAEFEVIVDGRDWRGDGERRDAPRGRDDDAAPRAREGDAARERAYRGGRGEGTRVVCASRDYRYRYCPVAGGVRDAELVDQLGRSECRYDRSWGYDRGGIWVDRGCAAEFIAHH